jgi:hypothetical protein
MARCRVLAAATFAILLGTTGCKDATPPPQPTPTAAAQPAAATEPAAKAAPVTGATETLYVTEEQLNGIKISQTTTQLVFERLDDTSPGFIVSFPTKKPAACLNAAGDHPVCEKAYECDLNLQDAKYDRVYYKLDPNPACPGNKSKQIPFSVVHCNRGCQ